MFKTTSVLPVLVILLILAPMIGTSSLQAFPKGLIRSSDFSQIYWVDRFGVSHNVSDTGMIPVYFKNDRIKEIAWEDWMRIPKGGPITAATPPEFYDTSTTRINLQGTGVPNPYNATTTTSYRTVLTQPRVETQTTTTRTPARITSRILRDYQPDPLGRMQVTNGSSILDVREQPGTSTTVVRHTETMNPVMGQTEETSTRQTVTQREVQVMTPEVTQIGTERMPSTARQEQRTVTTYANAPRAEQRTTTTVTSPANNQRTVTTYGTSPDGDRRTTTTVTDPANDQRTVTTYSNSPPVYFRTSDGDSTRTETRTEYNVPTTETVERMP